MNFLPYLSTLVAFPFTIVVYNRYRQRGGVHLLLWAIGLLFYSLGTLSEVILGLTPNIFVLKIWYFMGAMMTAAWLGTGTVHLLIRKGNTAITITWILVAISVLTFFLVMIIPLTGASYEITRPASEQYPKIFTKRGFDTLLLAPTILLNSYGALTLVGGSLYSAYIFWRKKILANRIYGNILIAAGALSLSMGGTFIRAGLVDWLYLSEFVGAVLMFIGFMLATSGTSEPAPSE